MSSENWTAEQLAKAHEALLARNQKVTVCAFPACTCSTRVMCPIVLGHRTFLDRLRTFIRKWRWQKSHGLERLSFRFWFRWIITGRYQ